MLFIGRADCSDVDEFDKVMGELSEIKGIELSSAGLTITVTYSPKGQEKVLRAATVMADITTILEKVPTHGMSLCMRQGEEGSA